MACAGNINLDGITSENPKGIQDLVIGAPYDGENHQGAIYIYLGTSEGISQKHAQVILERFYLWKYDTFIVFSTSFQQSWLFAM